MPKETAKQITLLQELYRSHFNAREALFYIPWSINKQRVKAFWTYFKISKLVKYNRLTLTPKYKEEYNYEKDIANRIGTT